MQTSCTTSPPSSPFLLLEKATNFFYTSPRATATCVASLLLKVFKHKMALPFFGLGTSSLATRFIVKRIQVDYPEELQDLRKKLLAFQHKTPYLYHIATLVTIIATWQLSIYFGFLLVPIGIWNGILADHTEKIMKNKRRPGQHHAFI